MKTLADFKRALNAHRRWTFHYTDNNTDCGIQPREVAHVQTNGVWFFMPNRGNAKSWLDFPAAKHCRFPDPQTLVIDHGDEWGSCLTYCMVPESAEHSEAREDAA